MKTLTSFCRETTETYPERSEGSPHKQYKASRSFGLRPQDTYLSLPLQVLTTIMCGGAGTRFWPASREKLPKQFLSIFGNKPLIFDAFKRALGLSSKKDVYLIATDTLLANIKKTFKGMKKENVILEPAMRSTAPCLALSAFYLKNRYKDAVMVVLPADHIIPNHSEFNKILNNAIEFVKYNKALVTIGVEPKYPETGYGYIKVFDKDKDALEGKVLKVEKFCEKPNLETAKGFLENGTYYWNAGIFVFKISDFISELSVTNKDLYEKLVKLDEPLKKKNFKKIKAIYNSIDPISIDYALFEKSENVYTLKANFEWDDVGSWLAIEKFGASLNSGKGNVLKDLSINSSNNVVFAPGKIVATMDIKDLIIVNTDKVLMIIPKTQAQNVKQLLNLAKNQKLKDIV